MTEEIYFGLSGKDCFPTKCMGTLTLSMDMGLRLRKDVPGLTVSIKLHWLLVAFFAKMQLVEPECKPGIQS